MAGALLTGAGNVTTVNSGAGVGTTVALAKPANLVDGQFLVAVLMIRSATATLTLPTGWVLVDDGTGANQPSVIVAAKYVPTASAESSTYTFTWSASSRTAGIMAIATGLNTATYGAPLSAGSDVIVTSASTALVFGGGGGTSNDLKVCWACASGTETSNTWTAAAPLTTAGSTTFAGTTAIMGWLGGSNSTTSDQVLFTASASIPCRYNSVKLHGASGGGGSSAASGTGSLSLSATGTATPAGGGLPLVFGSFDDAITGHAASDAVTVTMTLPISGYTDMTTALQQFQVDKSTVTDLPDGTRLQVGYPQMRATFTLAGTIQGPSGPVDAATLFGQYQTTSPLWGHDALHAPVTIDVGVYPDGSYGVPTLIRQFTGSVDDYVVNPDGTVAFTCIDSSTLLRGAVMLLSVVTVPPYNAGLTSEYALDALLRESTSGAIGTWPPLRPQVILAVGYRASMWPKVGALNTSGAQPIPSFAPGAMGSAVTGTTVTAGALQYITHNTTAPIGTSLFVEFWVTDVFFPPSIGIHNAASLAFGIPLLNLTVLLSGPQIDVGGSLGGTGYAYPRSVGGSHYVSYKITLPPVGGTAWSATITFDGNTASSGALNFTTPRDATAWNLVTTQPLSATIEALQVTTETAPASNFGFVPQAVLDPSLNPLTVIPAISGDIWATIQQIADTELGVAGFDESGIFRFANRATIRSVPVTRTITSKASLVTLAIESTAAAVVNRAQYGYGIWSFGTTNTVWSLSTVMLIPRHSTIPIDVTTDTLVAQPDTTLVWMPDGSTDTTQSFYRASNDINGISAFTGGLQFTVTQPQSDQLHILVKNPSSTDAWLVSPASSLDVAAGTPLLRIAGLPITLTDSLTADYQWPELPAGAKSSRFGEIVYASPSNPWIEDGDAAMGLAKDVVIDMCVPRPNLTGVAIVPDPRVTLMQRVMLVDTDETNMQEYATIFASTLNYATGSITQTVDARTVAAPAGWILGVTGRSELALTTYLYAGS